MLLQCCGFRNTPTVGSLSCKRKLAHAPSFRQMVTQAQPLSMCIRVSVDFSWPCQSALASFYTWSKWIKMDQPCSTCSATIIGIRQLEPKQGPRHSRRSVQVFKPLPSTKNGKRSPGAFRSLFQILGKTLEEGLYLSRNRDMPTWLTPMT